MEGESDPLWNCGCDLINYTVSVLISKSNDAFAISQKSKESFIHSVESIQR